MKGCKKVLLAFLFLCFVALTLGKEDEAFEDVETDGSFSELDDAPETSDVETKDPFWFGHRRRSQRRRRAYVRRRRAYVRRRRAYVRRRRAYVRRRRAYVRRRRAYVRRRRAYVRRRRAYVRRRRAYVRRRRAYARRRRAYGRRRRSYARRRSSYSRRITRPSASRGSWRNGDGIGGYELRIGSFANRGICYQRCLTRRYKGKLANGATVDRRTGRNCYCEFGMKRRNRNYKWISTFISRAKRTTCIPKGNFKFDSCGRRCIVLKGRLVNCCRVRKDFESMTKAEQQRYTRAFKMISTRQPYKRAYDRLIKMHERYFDTRIHQQQEFLPWHRWFNLQIENLLQKVDCRVTLAYWDWSVWSHDPWNTKRLWNPLIGFGGNGRRADGCVTVGPFRVGSWRTTSGNCLRRGFNGNPPDADQVAITLREPTFKKFEVMLRVNLHDSIHCFINGTMCSSKSAEAPEFFLHHGFVDKIWADYQKQSRKNKMAFFPSIRQRMIGLRYFPRDLVDNNKLPGGVRVCYEDPTTHSARRIRKFLSKLSFKQLKNLHRMAFSRTPVRAENMFKVSTKERKLAKSLENEAMKNVDSKRSSSIFSRTLSSLERVEGFKIPPYCSQRRYGDEPEE